MKIMRFLILVMVLWNMPAYMLAYFGATLGSLTSYALSLLLLAFFFLSKGKITPPLPFVLLTILYFTISGFNYSGLHDDEFVKEFTRSIILVVCSAQVLYKTTDKEIFFLLLIGAISVIINATVFPMANANFSANFGRYSGFYLNPNAAGAICIGGYAFVYAMKNPKIRMAGQFIFTVAGILTFSRTFILIWLFINVFSIFQNRKNLVAPIIGAVAIILIFSLSSVLSLNTERFTALESIFSSEQEIKVETIEKDSRTQTWAMYTDAILDKPLFGNGYMKLHGNHFGHEQGVHNAYLMVIGEAGILPFLLMIGLYFYLLLKSYSYRQNYPVYFYLSCAISLFLLTGHGYFDNYYNLFMSIYVYFKIKAIQPSESNAQVAT